MKFLSNLILYIMLFIVEYKKQIKKNPKSCNRMFSCERLYTKKLIIAATILCMNSFYYNQGFAFCSAKTACKISDIKSELEQIEQLKQDKKAHENNSDSIIFFHAGSKINYKTVNYEDLFIYRKVV